jgi:hypothetical protein
VATSTTTSSTSRARLRILDACLTELEEANERDEVAVSERLASRLGAHVRTLAPGMRIADAIELVLSEQEPHLRRSRCRPAAVSATRRQPLDAAAAGALTERIRDTRHHACLLLLEAHEGHAAAALGYASWADYVRREFGLSRRRSYELLDQGRVVRAVQAAAGMCGIPHISAQAAEDIKPRLIEVTGAIRQRVRGLPEPDRSAVVVELVRAARATAAQTRAGRGGDPEPASAVSDAVLQLVHAIDCLAHMPRPEEVRRWMTPDQAPQLRRLRDALAWLSEFARVCDDRPRGGLNGHKWTSISQTNSAATGSRWPGSFSAS